MVPCFRILPEVYNTDEKEKALLKIMEHMTGRNNFVIPEEAIHKVAVMKIEVNCISGKVHK
jgi:hypothetical protein